MAALHLVSTVRGLESCLAVAAGEDAVLLLHDGVYAAVPVLAPDRPVHALEPDVAARGLTRRLSSHVEVIDDAGFVRLAERHQPIVTWR